ncbi:MAG TPA: GNAT family N-acetyltransferase [Cyclobacteriaceae bacterium]|jgi:RimJ/RimL family protein N-acetyltransferase|nr:GNAT family N-acetyltransferase [Cyclobacteriaceae bacterium]
MNYLLDGEESDRLRFRKLEPTDFKSWLPFFENPLSDRYWSGVKLSPEEGCKLWLNKTFERYANNKGGMNVLIDKSSGSFIGQCGLLVQTVDDLEELEVGYSILPAYWNKGYATEAARMCMHYAFTNNFRDSIISIIHENNVESEKVALKNNLILEKRTTYKDNPVKIYRIKKESFIK